MALLGWLAMACGGAGQSRDWRVTTSLTYETGDYGGGATVDTVYFPCTVRRSFERWDVALTIPFLYVSDSSSVVVVEGQPQGGQQTNVTSGASSAGLGDIVLRGTYYALEEYNDHWLDLALVGRIKFPTADRADGLGTGEFDETIGVECGKEVADDWTVYVDLYYTFIGSPSGIALDDQFTFEFGAGYRAAPSLHLTAFYRESTELVDGAEPPRDLMFDARYRLNETTRIFGGLSFGLSDGSPDFGLTTGASLSF
jgi:hypothetical protein